MVSHPEQVVSVYNGELNRIKNPIDYTSKRDIGHAFVMIDKTS